ncbi:MAG: twitching motility protein PilT [Lachnospiraceae bacterium]|nr:twitching motility protein PilT [Lachnospiraceae bacterium]MBR3807122.1 twitching motility protein PilT [Lachnospiraceae bacterium]MBR4061179.1 twitching motility protein PilT [Lachnospiraceae bacterium]
MVQLIVGVKGKGKTKVLLDKVNAQIQTVEGNIVYLDKSTKHMYELNNKIRLIDVSDYMIENADAFLGFILGIISQDHDLQQMYLDSFLKISHLEGADITETIQKLEKVSEKFKVDFTISVSMEADDVPEAIKSNIEVAV